MTSYTNDFLVRKSALISHSIFPYNFVATPTTYYSQILNTPPLVDAEIELPKFIVRDTNKCVLINFELFTT